MVDAPPCTLILMRKKPTLHRDAHRTFSRRSSSLISKIFTTNNLVCFTNSFVHYFRVFSNTFPSQMRENDCCRLKMKIKGERHLSRKRETETGVVRVKLKINRR